MLLAVLLSTAGPAADPIEAAKVHFSQGLLLFEAEENDAALVHFEKAYELSGKRASTILALAQCERNLGLYDRALAHLREYLQLYPDATDIAKVRNTIEVVEQLDRTADVAPPSPPQPPETPGGAEGRTSTPVADGGPLVAPAPAPVEESRSFWSSPVVWIGAGAIVAGSAVAIGVAASGEKDPYGGTLGVVARPLGLP